MSVDSRSTVRLFEPRAERRERLRVALEAAGHTVMVTLDLNTAVPFDVSAIVAHISLGAISELNASGRWAVVALVDPDEVISAAVAAAANIAALLPRHSDPRTVVDTLRMVERGLIVMPRASIPTTLNPARLYAWTTLPPEDQRIIGSLATGKTVRDAARAHGYSERTLHRRLRDMYDHVGAANLTEVIAVATAVGFVALPEPAVTGVSNKGTLD